jgi:3-polyprenyl-4-hydroxybenzoate decarboxylase
MDEDDLHSLLKETTDVAVTGTSGADTADNVLEQLQHAVKEHERILHQQELLIRQLRQQLKEVDRDGRE